MHCRLNSSQQARFIAIVKSLYDWTLCFIAKQLLVTVISHISWDGIVLEVQWKLEACAALTVSSHISLDGIVLETQ